MQVSRNKKDSITFSRTPLAAGVMVALTSPAVLAQESFEIEEIVVTAQKRSENLQDVPISIQAIGEQSIKELNLQNFKDYAAMLPSVAMTPTLGAGSSFSLVYMRGIATAGDGQATTSVPSVGMYLDELSTTTIQGNLDVHMYDVARVEALAGPQGTLYGASSQAGTIRVITNKPELGQFSSSVSLEANTVDEGGTGYVGEGYVNLPIGDNAAIRLVGWSRSDAGWIDNVAGTRTFRGRDDTDPLSSTNCLPDCSLDDITINNSALAEKDYNTLDTIGARAALRVDLNDDWTITPSLMFQSSESKGSYGDDLSDFVPGDYAVTHFKQEFTDDEWGMVGLTIEGRLGNWDIVYAGSYLDRQVDGSYDYADYSYWYEEAYVDYYNYAAWYADLHFLDSGARAFPNNHLTIGYFDFDTSEVGTRAMTGARFTNDDNYTKENHELRISSDPDNRLRGLIGYFWQHQYHDFEQHWIVDDSLATVMELNGGGDPRFEDTVYLNSMFRNDRDTAFFGSLSFDITEDVELTVGTRFFSPQVTVKGFFGFGLGFAGPWSGNGEVRCNLPQFNGQTDYFDKPCLNVDKGIKESDNVSRVNVNWHINDDHMVYATWSEGYRPGGINRDPNAGEYISDFLTNYEAGWKTQWADNRFQFNGAIFKEDWDDFQVSFTGDNAITAVNNGPTAEVIGLEASFVWLPTENLKITSGLAFYDTELKSDYCNFDAAGTCTEVLAPSGTKLPVTADFKGNLVARYMFEVGGMDAHLQAAVAHEGERGSDMEVSANDIRGDVPEYTTVDLSAGVRNDSWGLNLFVKNATGEDAPLYLTGQCTAETCGQQNYGVRIRPMTIGVKFTMDFD